MKKLVVATVALATIAATAAVAAPARNRAQPWDNGVDVTGPAAASYPTAVIVVGRYVGQDPDLFIRQKLLQDAGVSDN